MKEGYFMKKPKLILSHTILDTFVSSSSLIEIERHKDVKTGITMFSFNIDKKPVVTCDNYLFLRSLFDVIDIEDMSDLLDTISIYQCLTKSESED